MKFPQGEGSAVIHRKKNDLLYKDATCHSSWPCDFIHSVTFFSSLFSILLLLLSLLILPVMAFSLAFYYQVLFHCWVVLFQGQLSSLIVAFHGFFCGSFYFECFLSGLFLTPSSHLFLWFVSFGCFLGSSLLSVLFQGIVHMRHRLWQGDCNRKQVVNRLKIPQGLSTLLFHRWSEVPSRGGVRGDSP